MKTKLAEYHHYGSSAQGRFATWKPENISYSTTTITPTNSSTLTRNVSQKEYELKDHLGNVRLVFSDMKDVNFGQVGRNRYKLDVRAVNNYYPFGMLMPDMSWQSSGYRYGFGGHEMDNDVKGTGNHSSFGDYGYDNRTGRRYMLEPMISKYPSLSPYVAYADNPILFTDPDGRDIYIIGHHPLLAIEALKTKTCLDIQYDEVSGHVKVTGKPQTLYDEILLEMSRRNDVIVILQTTISEFVSTPRGDYLEVLIGAFDGNYLKENGRHLANQYINMENSKKIEDGGLSDQGTDVLHELLEAYLYTLKNPNMGFVKVYWDIAHEDAMFFDPEAKHLGQHVDWNHVFDTYGRFMHDVSNQNHKVKLRNITKEEFIRYRDELARQKREEDYNDDPLTPDPRRLENGDY